MKLKGRELLTESRKWQEEIFDYLVSDRPESEAAAFAQALERLAQGASYLLSRLSRNHFLDIPLEYMVASSEYLPNHDKIVPSFVD